METNTTPTAQPSRKGGFAKPFAIGLLAGTLAIGAPVGGAVGGLAGAGIVMRMQPAQQQTVPVSVPITQPSTTPISAITSGSLDVAALFKQASPSVVQINVSSRQSAGLGSGFVIDNQGHIMTNNHVIDGATTITVKFSTGETAPATVVGRDPQEDVAILKTTIPASAKPLVLANSDNVVPGEPVVAIGSPLGLDYSVTSGIVSGVQRTAQASPGRAMRGLIQTDAAINPGNSGGPLLNAKGEVIGMNTLGETDAGGIGFAVPMNTATKLLPRLLAGETVTHSYLGISTTDDAATTNGVTIAEVTRNGPAAKGGLQAGDVIQKVGNVAIKNMDGLRDAIDSYKVGEQVEVTILRGGQTRTVTVTTAAWPQTAN